MKKVISGNKIIVISIPIIIILLLIIFPYFFPKKYAILTYHEFTSGIPKNNMQKNVDEFKKEMKYLRDHHYKTLTLKDVECYMDKKCELPRKSVLITFDDGWKNAYELAFPILKEYNFNATLFYLGENIDRTNSDFISKDELEIINKDYPNIEIASHTYQNHFEEAYNKSEEELEEDFKMMENVVDTKYFAYPYGRYSDNYIKVLKKNNYKLAFAFGGDIEYRKFDNKDNRYLIPRYSFSTTYPYWKFVLRMYMPF